MMTHLQTMVNQLIFQIVIVAAFVVVLFIWDTDGITTIHTVITPILIFALVSVLFAFQSLHGFQVHKESLC